MYKLTLGQCLNCINGFVCTESKAHQNYPCPYGDPKKCPYYIAVTAEMVEQLKTKGYIHIPAPAYIGIGETTK